MVGVGRDLWGSSSPTPLPKQGHLQQAAQDLVQGGLEYLQRRRIHNLPGQPVPVLRHPQREEAEEVPHLLLPPGHSAAARRTPFASQPAPSCPRWGIQTPPQPAMLSCCGPVALKGALEQGRRREGALQASSHSSSIPCSSPSPGQGERTKSPPGSRGPPSAGWPVTGWVMEPALERERRSLLRRVKGAAGQEGAEPRRWGAPVCVPPACCCGPRARPCPRCCNIWRLDKSPRRDEWAGLGSAPPGAH